jgi:uncharacterized SAM-dependent methyltransferase
MINSKDMISGNGYLKWDNLVQKRAEYYPFQEEKEILQKFKTEIQGIVGEQVHISSLGPGTEFCEKEKTLEIMKAFPTVLSYTAVNTSLDALNGSKKAVIDEFGDQMSIQTIQQNMFTNLNYKITGTPNLAVLLGYTIANFDDAYKPQIQNLSHNIKAVMDNLPHNSYLLIGYDRNKEPESLAKAYDNQEMHELMLTSLYTIACSDNIEGLSPENFRCVVKWEPEISSIGFYARPTRKQTFSVGRHKVTIDKNKLMHIGNSSKISEKDMRLSIQEAANENKIQLLKHFEIGTDRMAIAMVYKN